MLSASGYASSNLLATLRVLLESSRMNNSRSVIPSRNTERGLSSLGYASGSTKRVRPGANRSPGYHRVHDRVPVLDVRRRSEHAPSASRPPTGTRDSPSDRAQLKHPDRSGRGRLHREDGVHERREARPAGDARAECTPPRIEGSSRGASDSRGAACPGRCCDRTG